MEQRIVYSPPSLVQQKHITDVIHIEFGNNGYNENNVADAVEEIARHLVNCLCENDLNYLIFRLAEKSDMLCPIVCG